MPTGVVMFRLGNLSSFSVYSRRLALGAVGLWTPGLVFCCFGGERLVVDLKGRRALEAVFVASCWRMPPLLLLPLVERFEPPGGLDAILVLRKGALGL